jgi:hypothetical protein
LEDPSFFGIIAAKLCRQSGNKKAHSSERAYMLLYRIFSDYEQYITIPMLGIE